MVENVVKIVMDKMTNREVKEVLQSYHVDIQVQPVHRELKWIQGFIKGVDKKRITSPLQEFYLREVRDVAYSIEDAIDIFLMDIPKKSTGMREAIKRILRRTKNIPAVRKLVKDMYWIQTRMEFIQERRQFYEIYDLGSDEIVRTSFEDLPFVLKSCFMYFAAFPKNYVIDAKLLLQMWIADGFIPQEDNRTLEETAESFLEDLVRRSMIEATVRNTDGSIKRCHLFHGFHDLAIQKAEEDNFLVAHSQLYSKPSLSFARRVAIIHQSDCHGLMLSPNLRTLLCFHSECVPINCLKQRLLKVVSIQGDPSKTKIAMEMFEGLCHLRYLHLEGCSDRCESECWEKSMAP